MNLCPGMSLCYPTARSAEAWGVEQALLVLGERVVALILILSALSLTRVKPLLSLKLEVCSNALSSLPLDRSSYLTGVSRALSSTELTR